MSSVPSQFKGFCLQSEDRFSVIEELENGNLKVKCETCSPVWRNRGTGYMDLGPGETYLLTKSDCSGMVHWMFYSGRLPWMAFLPDGTILYH